MYTSAFLIICLCGIDSPIISFSIFLNTPQGIVWALDVESTSEEISFFSQKQARAYPLSLFRNCLSVKQMQIKFSWFDEYLHVQLTKSSRTPGFNWESTKYWVARNFHFLKYESLGQHLYKLKNRRKREEKKRNNNNNNNKLWKPCSFSQLGGAGLLLLVWPFCDLLGQNSHQTSILLVLSGLSWAWIILSLNWRMTQILKAQISDLDLTQELKPKPRTRLKAGHAQVHPGCPGPWAPLIFEPTFTNSSLWWSLLEYPTFFFFFFCNAYQCNNTWVLKDSKECGNAGRFGRPLLPRKFHCGKPSHGWSLLRARGSFIFYFLFFPSTR